jgi:hypothetical protein
MRIVINYFFFAIPFRNKILMMVCDILVDFIVFIRKLVNFSLTESHIDDVS